MAPLVALFQLVADLAQLGTGPQALKLEFGSLGISLQNS
jgi:hypothetical protein